MLAKYLKPDLLIIDDRGIKQLPKRSGEFLFEIILLVRGDSAFGMPLMLDLCDELRLRARQIAKCTVRPCRYPANVSHR